MLLGTVFAVGSFAHRCNRAVQVMFAQGNPPVRRCDLDIELLRPVRLVRRCQLGAKASDFVDVTSSGPEVSGTCRTECAAEPRDRLRLGIRRARWLQRRGFRPRSALNGITNGDRRKSGVCRIAEIGW